MEELLKNPSIATIIVVILVGLFTLVRDFVKKDSQHDAEVESGLVAKVDRIAESVKEIRTWQVEKELTLFGELRQAIQNNTHAFELLKTTLESRKDA